MPRFSIDGDIDPSSEEKDLWEDELAELFGTAFEDMFGDLEEDFDPNNPSMPDPSFWERWALALSLLIAPSFAEMAEDSAETEADLFGVEMDPEILEAEAANWARTYTFSLVTDINGTTEANLQEALQKFFEDQDMEALTRTIEKMFSPVRAEMIARTEVSRGYSRGVTIYKNFLESQGIFTEEMWITEDDGAVCVICAPNHEIRKSEGWTVPDVPAHPRCRCWKRLIAVVKSIIINNGGLINVEKNEKAYQSAFA
jgi:hypothetical protein